MPNLENHSIKNNLNGKNDELLKQNNDLVNKNTEPLKENNGISIKDDEVKEAFFRKMVNAVLHGKREIDVQEFNIATNKDVAFYSEFLYKNPSFFHVNLFDGEVNTKANDEKTLAYKPVYFEDEVCLGTCTHAKDVLSLAAKMESKLEEYYNELQAGMSDAEIAYVLGRKMVEDVVYSKEGADKGYAINVFLSKTAKCLGYAHAYRMLLDPIGIRTELADYPKHIWNRVLIDGSWYNVDMTWDDNADAGFTGAHFLTSDDKFFKELKHPLPENPAAEPANKTRFEDIGYFFRKPGVLTDPVYRDGYWYLKAHSKDKVSYIKRRFEPMDDVVIVDEAEYEKQKSSSLNRSGSVALRTELALCKFRDMYFHGDENYYEPKDSQRIEFLAVIEEAENFLKNKSSDLEVWENQATDLYNKLKNLRTNYNMPKNF